MHRITHDCNHRYSVSYCSIDCFFQTGFSIILQDNTICLGRNAHIHIIKFIIGCFSIRPHDLKQYIIGSCFFLRTVIYCLPKMGIRAVHDHVVLVFIYFLFLFIQPCFFNDSSVIGFSCHISKYYHGSKKQQDAN